MKIYEKDLNIELICYVAKSSSSTTKYYTKNRQTDSFVYVLSGAVEYCDDNKSFIGQKGDVLYLSRGSNYKINISSNDYSFLVVNFLFKESSNVLLENELFVLNDNNLIDSKFIKLNKIWPLSTTESRLQAKSILYDIYANLCTISINDYLPTDSKNNIIQIAEYIINHSFDENLNISNIIEKYDISEAHFRRLFKSIYGVSPIKFVQNIRINRAKQLLINESIPINQISKLCGYEDEYYFSRIFKKTTGMTASGYRKESQIYYK